MTTPLFHDELKHANRDIAILKGRKTIFYFRFKAVPFIL